MAKLAKKTTSRARSLVTPASLAGVEQASWNLATAEQACRVALLAAGGNSAKKADVLKIQAAFYIGRIARAEFPKATAYGQTERAKAVAILAYAGQGAASIGKKAGRRTEDQEKAYTAARVAFTRLLGATNTKAPRPKKTRAPKATKVAEKDAAKVAPIVAAPAAPIVPAFKTTRDLHAHFQMQAASDLALLKKNAKATGGHLVRLNEIVAAFAKDLASLKFDD